MAVEMPAVEVVGREIAYQGFFRLERVRLRHRRFAGDWSPVLGRDLLFHPQAAAVLPYDPLRDEVVLIEQFRTGAFFSGHHGWMLEIPAGMIDTAEPPAEVARREAAEEAGLVVDRLEQIARYMPSPGSTTEWLTVFCGRTDAAGAAGIHGLATEHEDIRVVVMPAAAALARLDDGGIENAFTVIALQWLAAHRSRLSQRWL